MLSLDIDLRPSMRLATGLLKRLDRELRNMRNPVERSAHNVLGPSIVENFTTAGRGRWQPLSEATRLQREAEGFDPDQPLIRSGALERASAQRSRWTITNTEARYGKLPASTAYGRFHMTGTDTMPARPWAVAQTDDVDAVEKTFDRWVGATTRRTLAGWR